MYRSGRWRVTRRSLLGEDLSAIEHDTLFDSPLPLLRNSSVAIFTPLQKNKIWKTTRLPLISEAMK